MTMQAFCGGDLRHAGAATLLRLLIVAPLLEEWIVRAGVQEWLMRRAPAGAPVRRWRDDATVIVLAALFFSLLHARAGFVAASQVFWPGLVLGALYRQYRDWRSCALLHAIFNGMALGACAVVF
jgi:membrane protease YdiL (CAAX protease family)